MAESDGAWSDLLRTGRGVLMLTGLAVFALGAAIVFVPGAASLLPVGALIAALGSDYVVLAAVGVVAIGFAVLVAIVRALAGVDEAAVSVVESVASAPHPGQSVDRSADGAGRLDPTRSEGERLREAAVKTLVRTEHCSRATAERTLAEGTWTDDDVAADFLAGADDGLFRDAGRTDEPVGRTARAINRLDDRERATDRNEPDDTGGDDDGSRRGDRAESEQESSGGSVMTNPADRRERNAVATRRDEDLRRGGAGTGGS
jgi:hypothetical protein